MPQDVIKSYNIWVDTDAANLLGKQKGDVFNMALGSQSLTADSGQYIRLTLNNFFMYKQWSNVNYNNSLLHFIIPGAATGFLTNYDLNDTGIVIPRKNYRSIYDLAMNFGLMLANHMNYLDGGTAADATFTVTVNNPPILSTIPGTTDDIIDITLTQTQAFSSGALTAFNLVALEQEGESYLLLGGDRQNKDDYAYAITGASTNETFTMYAQLIPGGSNWSIVGLYPAQRTTMPYVYLRSRLSNVSIESFGLSEPVNPNQPPISDVSTSQILAKIPVDTEVCVYDSNYGGDYFLNIYNRHISSIYLYLTDEHNRPIGRPFNSSSLTATTGDEHKGLYQSTKGNLQFNAVFRVDVIQARLPSERLFDPVPNPLNPKTSSQFYNPGHPPNGDDTPDANMRELTLLEHSKRNFPVRKAGGMVGRGV